MSIAYRAETADETALPAVLKAARHLRRAVVALAPATVPAGAEPLETRASAVADTAAAAVEACAVVSELLRTVQTDIRGHRGVAANTVVCAHRRLQHRAAERPADRLAAPLC
ncbi:hypothetical protein [Streptomyces sp. NRRL B-24484]|uniref:hypothetical protein n=1 Tax=Streptomyces sp. NRRL B-24484 TaxID=1463833 RepID=UPI0004C0116E|nr:hypothetical protein [Streptomyces sp. NRRL B-24484]